MTDNLESMRDRELDCTGGSRPGETQTAPAVDQSLRMCPLPPGTRSPRNVTQLAPNRHVGDAEPGHQRHCWWLKHYLSAPPPGSDQSEPATCILYIEIVPPSDLLSGIPYSQP